ncbi:MAG: hypothetical protein ICV68_14685, partial [Pyrinomonadaceae bacterium]|nr:hypothetical protein [Pyrinomonadaceae bacterium]
MWRRVALAVALLSTLCWIVTATAFAFQGNDLVYVIRFADVSGGGLEVQFGNDVPPDAAVEDENNWLITTVNLQNPNDERRFPPDSATVAHTPAGSIVTLVV